MLRRRTSWLSWRGRMREAAGGRKRHRVGGERSAAHDTGRAARAGRLRAGRAVERRLSSQRAGGRDRPQRSLLHRLSRQSAGADFGGEVRLPVPGTALYAGRPSAAARRLGPAPGAVRHLICRITIRSPIAAGASGLHRLHQPRPVPRHHGAAAAGPGHAHAVSRARSSPRPARSCFSPTTRAELRDAGARGAHSVSLAVPQPGRSRRCARTIRDPADLATFERCKLDFAERAGARGYLPDAQRSAAPAPRGSGVSGAAPGAEWMARCWRRRPSCCAILEEGDDDRLVLVNLGLDLRLDPAPEPLLAPPARPDLERAVVERRSAYGGSGTGNVDSGGDWTIPGHAAVVMRPVEPKEAWRI